MLKSIKITKLFGRFDYELSLSNEGIMIITGPNGYGKSTILRIINNFCNDGLEKVLAYAFNKLVIVSENGSIQITKNNNNFKINDFEFPYPNEKWDRRHGIPPFLRRIDYDEFIDLRTSEKIQLMGSIPKQLRLWDDDIVEQNFAFSVLDAYEGDLSTKKLKDKMEELNKTFDEINRIQKDIGKVHFIQEQ